MRVGDCEQWEGEKPSQYFYQTMLSIKEKTIKFNAISSVLFSQLGAVIITVYL